MSTQGSDDPPRGDGSAPPPDSISTPAATPTQVTTPEMTDPRAAEGFGAATPSSPPEGFGASPGPGPEGIRDTQPEGFQPDRFNTGPVIAGGFAPVPGPSSDEPILPASVDDDALRDAVGAAPRKRKKKVEPVPSVDDADLVEADPSGKMSRKTILVIALSLIVGLGIAALVLLGRVNSDRYHLSCTTTQAIAEQGRAFPPWGYKALTGAEWKPIALPPNAQCKSEELEDLATLEAKFLALLVERTSAALGARNFIDVPPADGKTAPLDVIAAQLEQGLLLSRAPERGDERKQVERMLGDVQYWRASLRLREASAALIDASRQFDAAALQRPMHVSDAGAWAEFLRRLTEMLSAGPAGLPAALGAPAPTPTTAPQGTALPVEPEPPAAGSADPASPPDAGVPTGGVLL